MKHQHHNQPKTFSIHQWYYLSWSILSLSLILMSGSSFALSDEQVRIKKELIFSTPIGVVAPDETVTYPSHPHLHGYGMSASGKELNKVLPLMTGTDALSARLAVIAKAQEKIDLQSYIFHNDTSGVLVLNALLAASQRGVKVRILLDDMNMKDIYPSLAMLAHQPNIEIRLFNYLKAGSMRWLAFVRHPFLSNRRMHAKSITTDDSFAIVGGRNIGNEYFEAGVDAHFKDLDVVAAGPIVSDVITQFDAFWESELSINASTYLANIEAEKIQDFQARSQRFLKDPKVKKYLKQLDELTGLKQLLLNEKKVSNSIDAAMELLVDSPEKVMGDLADDDERQIVVQLKNEFANPKKELNLVSPYFVPGRLGVQAISELVKSGVKVRILTNSLAATDVGSVHAGYAKYRKDLLLAGVELWELKADPLSKQNGENLTLQNTSVNVSSSDYHEVNEQYVKNSLHAKTFSADSDRYFVGSFNLDPRSAFLNAEMGLLIESTELVNHLNRTLDQQLPMVAWRLQLDSEQNIIWSDQQGQKFNVDPGSSWLQRLWLQVLSWLPIEWAL